MKDDFLLRIHKPGTSQSVIFGNASLVSGTLQNGVWQSSVVLPQGSAAGQWMIQAFSLADLLNNRTSSFVDVKPVTVISAATTDVAVPTVVSSHIPTPTPLDVTNASAALTVKVRLSDDTGVKDDFLLRIHKPGTSQSVIFGNASLVSGTLQNGVWQSSVVLPQGSAAGQWMIQAFSLADLLNNRTSSFVDVKPVTVISG